MIPTPRLAWLAAIAVPLVLLGLLDPMALWAGAAYDVALLFAVAADRWATGAPRSIAVERALPGRWIQGRESEIVLRVSSEAASAVRVRIRDVPPATLEVDRTSSNVRLRPAGRSDVRYRAVPRERGVHRFGDVTVRTRGPLGLVERQRTVALATEIRVHPDLTSMSAREAALLAPSAWRTGLRLGRLRGEGREFHQLRDYQAGDDLRIVDWKAFAHRGRPVVRELRPERNQRVLMLVDAGRMMTTRVADRLRFDWALQAAGRLARAALVLGDVAGLTVFSRDIKASLPASRGPGHLRRMSDLMSDVRPDLDEPDLGLALTQALRRNPRRTLVVLFTELSDPGAAEAALRHLGSLGRKHLALVVTLADADLERERNLPVDGVDDAFRRLAADELWQVFLTTERALQARGAWVVRARADALAAETVARYVEIKRLGRL